MTSYRPSVALAVACCLTFASTAIAQNNNRTYPPEIDGAKKIDYKHAGDVTLSMWVFAPEGHTANDKRPAVVFFFGGGWNNGSPQQFVPFCEALAKRGMVAATADYRVASRHGVKAVDCVRDAKSAVRYLREHADELGIDPNRIAAGGGSAGGHLAAATGTIKDFDEPGEDLQISSRPNAMLLCNPACVLAPVDGMKPLAEDRMAGLAERMGVDPKQLSPYHNIDEETPPAIIFHGTNDTTVPFVTARLFSQKLSDTGAKCVLAAHEGQGHGFFNHGRDAYAKVFKQMDAFLVELGYLK